MEDAILRSDTSDRRTKIYTKIGFSFHAISSMIRNKPVAHEGCRYGMTPGSKADAVLKHSLDTPYIYTRHAID
jgi:hypothetical protein